MVARTDTNRLGVRIGAGQVVPVERDWSKTLPLLLMVVLLVLSPFLFDIMQWVQSLLGGI